MQRTGGQARLLWFPVVFSLVYFDLFKRPFLPGGWCVVFAFIGMLIFMEERFKIL